MRPVGLGHAAGWLLVIAAAACGSEEETETTAPTAVAGPRAYVSLPFLGQVAVVATATNVVIDTITVGGQPGALAASPRGDIVYVADQTSPVLTVIETATNTVSGSITLSFPAVDVAVAPGGSIAYTTGVSLTSGSEGGAVDVISTGTGSVIASVRRQTTGGPDRPHPVSVAFSPDGTRAYVADLILDALVVMETSSHTVIGTSSPLFEPSRVATAPGGDAVYVASIFDSLSIVAPATRTVSALIEVRSSSALGGLAVSPDGRFIYVVIEGAPQAGGGVAVVEAATRSVTRVLPISGGPRNVAFAPDGRTAYVATERWLSVINVATPAVSDSVQLPFGGGSGGGGWVVIVGGP